MDVSHDEAVVTHNCACRDCTLKGCDYTYVNTLSMNHDPFTHGFESVGFSRGRDPCIMHAWFSPVRCGL